MKRWMSWLLLIAVLLTARRALAVSGYLETDGRLADLVGEGETVYYMLEDTRDVYAWNIRENEPTFCGQGGEALVIIDGSLYTLDRDSASLRLLSGDGASADGMKLPVDKLVKDRNTDWSVNMMQWAPDGLYWLMNVDDSDGVELCRYNPSTGAFSHKKINRLHAYCAVGDGTVYVVEPDEEGRKVSRYSWSTKQLAYVAYVPQGANGFVLEGENLLCVADKEVYRMTPDGSVTLVMKTPVRMDSRFAGCLMQGDWYVTGMWSEISARSISRSSGQSVRLTVLGGEGPADSGFTAFMLERPEVDVTLLDMGDITDASALMRKLMTGELDNDIIVLDARFDLEQLMAKGYLEDLSSNEALMRAVESMYPALQSAVMTDGRLYAVPCGLLGCNLLIVSTDHWERAGLTPEQIPTSWTELVRFMREDYPDVSEAFNLVWGESREVVRNVLLPNLLRQAVMEPISAGEPPRMNTPAFKELFRQFDQALSDAERRWHAGSYHLLDGGIGSDTLALMRNADSIMLLSLDGTGEPLVPVRMWCYAINPRSENKELAVEYILACLNTLSNGMRLTLFPDERTPILSDYYLLRQPQLQREIDALERQMAAAEEGAEEWALREALALKLREQEALEESMYDVSPAMIDCYRERIAPHLFVPNSMAMSVMDASGGSFVFDSAIAQYTDHRMTLDQFAAEVDRVITMIEMERME